MKIEYDASLFKKEIDKLKEYDKKFPWTFKSSDKYISCGVSEIHYSLHTEGELSSRREIQSTFKNSKQIMSKTNYVNFIKAFDYVFYNKNIEKNDVYTLYNILTRNIDMGNEQLEKDALFRKDNVTIGQGNYKGESFFGSDPSNVEKDLAELIDYIKSDQEEEIIIKAIVAHYIFELIHPYYDFNGRLGRLLPIWIMSIHDKFVNCLFYFSTAVGSFRETYLKAFKDSVLKRKTSTDKVQYDINKFVKETLRLLLINQYQYSFLKTLEDKVNDNGHTLTNNERLVIMALLMKYERQQNADAWCKADFAEDIDINLKLPQYSKLIKDLETKGVISKVEGRPVKIKLKLMKYKLYGKD